MVSIHVLYSIPGPGSSPSEVCFQQHLAAQHDQPGTVGLLLKKGAPPPPPQSKLRKWTTVRHWTLLRGMVILI